MYENIPFRLSNGQKISLSFGNLNGMSYFCILFRTSNEKMRRRIIFCLLCVWMQISFAQNFPSVLAPYPGGKCMMYRLYLKDKDLCHSPFSLTHPEAYLSARSIERRRRQRLSLDESDLPVAPAYVDSVRRAGGDVVGRSKWNNTLLVRVSHDEQAERLGALPFVTRMVRVFTSPDSVATRRRTRFKDHFENYMSSRHMYGASARQIGMLGGNRLHDKDFRGKGMMTHVHNLSKSNEKRR